MHTPRRAFSTSPALATSRTSTSPPASDPPVEPTRPVSAAAYLAAQAAEEEAAAALAEKEKKRIVPDPDAWTGEESRERMLKRILEDQYKPLRVKGFEKPIPQPAPLPSQAFESSDRTEAPSNGSTLRTTTLNPWDVTFKPPEHYRPLPGYRAPSTPLGGPSISAKKALLATARKDAALSSRPSAYRHERLASAYERTLDYRGGVRSRGGGGAGGQFSGRGIAVPVHEDGGGGGAGEMRMWEGFIEEKIKQARRDGVFNNVKGRGQPMPRDIAESNPFISRTEFLMNRILKEQEAAPPWIEMQKELETALANFRRELTDTWTRRAVRIRSSEGLTRAVVREIRDGWTDPAWEAKERAYHEASVSSLNELIRKYNIIAPYNVRRPLLALPAELKATFTSCAPLIAAELERRLDAGLGRATSAGLVVSDPGEVKPLTAAMMGGEQDADKKDTPWKAFKRALVEVLGKAPDPLPARGR
ncbi:hypothetical protein JCM10450v2_001043 [Rhodotorula kratochvilovae]